jgi:hypothetical protein
MNKQTEELAYKNNLCFENEKIKNDIKMMEKRLIDSTDHVKNLE